MTKHRRKKPLPEPVPDTIVGSLVHDGRCVARVDGKVVFIDGALPGERVAFEYLRTRRSFDAGRVTAIHEPSPDRVEPRCPHFGVCGGCSLQHMEPGAQLRAKQDVLLDTFRHIGKVAPEMLLPPLSGPVWGYRAKARLGVKYVERKGRVLVGFREKYSSFVAELSRCEVLAPAVGGRIRELAALLDRLEAGKRVPQVEVAVSGPVAVLVFRHLDPLGE
ncbi:MAG: TRAM domain-containing protein, partial [Gammaproteobacteria bacterium]